MFEYISFHIWEAYFYSTIIILFWVLLLYYLSENLKLKESSSDSNFLTKVLKEKLGRRYYSLRVIYYILKEVLFVSLILAIPLFSYSLFSKDVFCGIAYKKEIPLEELTVSKEYCTKVFDRLNSKASE